MYLINKTKLRVAFLFTIISFFTYGQSNVFRVTLDAGHGDHDYGATYNGHVEKNINLALVLKVGKLLEQNPKIDVIYTRKTDVFIDLIERANIANRANANIFVSIHCNANRNTAADGTESYVMGMSKVASNLEAAKKENSVITLEKDYKQKYEGFDPNSPETMIGMTVMQEEYLDNSITLASKVEEEFAAIGKKIRKGGGVQQAPFMVLHKAYMPRVLIETGFISNPVEGNVLDSEEGQNDIARAIADAIISYKNEFFGNGGSDDTERPSQKMIAKPAKDTSSEVPATKKTTNNKDATAVIFKVQLAASAKKLELIPSNFKGLKDISIESGTNLYKYMYGETTDYDEAKQLLQEAKSKGFDSAYLIAFKNGEKISVQDALNNK